MPTRSNRYRAITLFPLCGLLISIASGCGATKTDDPAPEVASVDNSAAIQNSATNESSEVGPEFDPESDLGSQEVSAPEPDDKSEPLYSPEAFCQAAHDGKLRVVEICIESGMDVNMKNADGICPLTMAAYNGHSDVVSLLIKNNATVDAVDRSGMTPLIHAASCPEPSAAETVRILIDAGADMGAVGGQEDWTALMMAASEGNIEVVKMLLSKGAKKDTVDTDGESAAHFAREHGHTAIIKLLESE